MTDVLAAQQTRRAGISASLLARVCLVVGLVAVAVVFAVTTAGFVTVDNFKSILLAAAYVGPLAVGETLIMIGGCFFSLSLAATTAASAMIFVASLKMGIPVAIIFALLFGALSSGLQGFAVGALDANPIVITIGAGVLIEGAALTITHGATVQAAAGTASVSFLSNQLAGVPFPFWVFAAVTLLAQLYLWRSRFGIYTYLVGDSKPAARAAALPVSATVIIAFAIAGACAAATGITIGAFQSSASLSVEGTLSFDAIAGTLIGGTAVMGGRGSVSRTFVGTLGITAISSALLLRGYPTGTQLLVRGLAVLVVVLIVNGWPANWRRG